MSFIDKVRITVIGGKGGDGCLSFHREKYVEFGGPDGGDGGDGGDVILEASSHLTTLLDLAHRPKIRGKDGGPGKGKKMDGIGGEDTVVPIPVGTVIWRDGLPVADLCAPGQRYLAASGSRGGRGNHSFKSQRNTAPRVYEKGAPGEIAVLDLELKLIADVGLVGFPNAGKSTLLARLTRARPKIADYPFTTLSPNLGVASHKGIHFVLADIPGLIEGAHAGKGLGTEFLRHIERTRILVHLVDPAGFGPHQPVAGVPVIEGEMKSYSAALARKPRVLALNKLDLPGAGEILKKLKKRYPKRAVFAISAATGQGTEALLDRMLEELSLHKPAPLPAGPEPEERVVRVKKGFTVTPLGAGRFRLDGPFVERATAQLDASLPEAVARYQESFKRIGVDRALRHAGIREGDLVLCGGMEFEWSDERARRLPILHKHPRTRLGGPPS